MRLHHNLLMPLTTLLILSARPALSQSTIFNVPTTDTVAKGHVYLEFDYLAQNPNTQGLDRQYIYSPRAVVGVSRNVEIGTNFPIYHKSFTTNAFFEPNVKWKFASIEKTGLAASVGGILITRLNNRSLGDTHGFVYGNVSKKVDGSYGPRFTLGPYGVVSAGPYWLGPKAGVILGYEQPVHSKASIVVDWLSGNNEFGYFTPGLSVKLPANSSLNIGYSFGNNSYSQGDRNNRSLFVYYGIRF